MEITTIDEEKEAVKKPKPKKKVEKVVIPMGYTKIRLDSLGKLTAPFELHFRDYSIEEVMELASTTEDVENLEVMVTVLNNMIFEDFDCGELTLQELLEVVYTLQGTYYSGEIERTIFIDDSESEETIDALIPLTALATKELAEEFKEPFYLKDSKSSDTKYGFRLPRIKDKIVAETYLKDKYKKEMRQFSEVYSEISKIEEIKDQDTRIEKMRVLEDEKFEEIESFRNYIFNKGKLMLAITQGLSLVSINGEEIEYGDCEKLLEIMPTISSRVWQEFTDILEKYDFGLEDEVTFFVPELQKTVTRRLDFRILDFLPDNEQKGDTGVSFSFE